MTASKAAELQRLYAQVPHIQCRRLCADSCGPIGFSREERRLIVKRAGKAPRANADLTCNLLVDGSCSVYSLRPMICRLWGVVKAMECQWGCKPDRWLSDAEAKAFLGEARRIGGEDDKHHMRELTTILSRLTGAA